MATPFLMYHELERPGHPLCSQDPGYVRYALEAARFEDQLAWLAERGLRGVSVSDADRDGLDARGHVVITFDDGCESDLTVAAPMLRHHGFTATFYIVSQWVGRCRGFLARRQVRALHDQGFEIGSHSATHAFLADLDDAALEREIDGSRRDLEDIIGAPVRHLSCPGGRWSRRVARSAADSGYATLATSRVGANGSHDDRYMLARCALLRHTPTSTFEAFARGTGLDRARRRERMLVAARTVLGDRLYTGLRSLALRQG